MVIALIALAGGREAAAQLTWGSDNAGNYSGGWSNGTDGGTGFAPWVFSINQGTGFAGAFIGNPGSAGITGFGTQAFGLYANPGGSGAVVTVRRPFDGPMAVGDSFSFEWAVNWDSDAGNKGFDFLTGGTTQIVRVNQGGFPGNITVNSATTGLGYGTNPMTWTVSLASPTELVVRATPRTGGTSVAYTGTFAVAGAPDAIALYANQMSGGDNRQPYFNNLSGAASGTFSSGGVRVESRSFTGGGSLTVGGSTTLVLTGGGNAYTGGSTIQAGSTLQIGDGVSNGSLPGNVANAGSLVFDPAGTSAYGGAISGTGGVVKQGAGAVTFSGANTYSGPTTISAGQLTMTTSSTLGGSITVAPGATLGVTLSGANAQLSAQTLSLGTLSNLTIDLGSLGAGTTAPLDILGAVTTSGAATINFTTTSFSVGSIPLIRYGSLTSFADLVLGQKPAGVQASLFNNTATNTVELLIQRTPRSWSGQASGAWAVGGPTNWTFLSGTTTTPTTFADGDAVFFDDSAAGTTAVTLAGSVSPSATTIDNTTKGYSFTGAGSISGSGGLLKLGSGTATMSTANTYTGATTIGGGRFEVATLANGGVASPLGASTAAAGNLVLSGGTLALTGAGAMSTNRGFSVGASGGGLEVTQAGGTATFSGDVVASGAFRKSGPGTLALTGTANALGTAGSFAALTVEGGRLSLAGSGSTAASQVNTVTGEMWVGTAPGGAALEMTNSTLTVSSWLSLDSGTASSLTNSAASVGNLRIGYDGGATPAPAAGLTLVDSTLASGGETIVGNSAGSSGVLSLSGNSVLTSAGPVLLANGSSSTGSVVVAGSSVLTGSSYMAVGNFGNGTLTVRDAARVSVTFDINVADLAGSSGALVVEGGTVATAGPVYIGKNTASSGAATVSGGSLTSAQFITLASSSASAGSMTLSGGVVSAAGELTIGDSGSASWTQTGGTASAVGTVFLARAGALSAAEVSVSGGLLAQTGSTGALVVGEQGQGSLTVSGSGRVLVAGAGGLVLSGGTTGFGVAALDGGTLEVTRVQRGSGGGALELNGGTLKAAANANANFMSGLDAVDVKAGGGFIDSSGQSIGIGQVLTGGGGLTKLGAGTVRLTGANTLTGPTTVSQGTLELGNAAALSSSAVTVAAGATLSVGPQVAATIPSLVNNGLVDVGLGGLTVTSGQTTEGIVAAIIAGRADGLWTGTSGITSSAAATQSERAVGWLNNGDGSFTVAFGAAGDWNLNGVVDFDDVVQFVSANLYDTGLPATWAEGDYDYNGVVDFDDVVASVSANLFDAGPYNTAPGGLSALGFGGDDLGLMSGGFTAVPEPAASVLLAAGLAAWGITRLQRRSAGGSDRSSPA